MGENSAAENHEPWNVVNLHRSEDVLPAAKCYVVRRAFRGTKRAEYGIRSLNSSFDGFRIEYVTLYNR